MDSEECQGKAYTSHFFETLEHGPGMGYGSSPLWGWARPAKELQSYCGLEDVSGRLPRVFRVR